jgi:tRNA (adenine37-N6)-methyltransferase
MSRKSPLVAEAPSGRAFTLDPIGYVRSPCTSPREIPGEGVPAEVIVAPEYADALEGVELSSHLIVVGWLHDANRLLLKNSRSRFHPGGPRRGVFATRCPSRPNPLSVSVARLEDRQGNRLRLDRLDLVDGTPVVDLKPYIPGEDAVFAATRSRRIPHASLPVETLATFLVPILERHLGRWANEAAARMALLAVMRATVHFGVDPRDVDLKVTVSRMDAAADALMALTGATFASGRLEIAPCKGRLRFHFAFRGEVLELSERARSEEVGAAGDSELEGTPLVTPFERPSLTAASAAGGALGHSNVAPSIANASSNGGRSRSSSAR